MIRTILISGLILVSAQSSLYPLELGELKLRGFENKDRQAQLESLIQAQLKQFSKKPGTLVIEISKIEDLVFMAVDLQREDKSTDSRLVKLESLKELDIALKRAITSLLESTALKNTAERGAVLSAETSAPTRVKSLRGGQISTGVFAPLTDSFGTYRPFYNLGASWGWDLDLAVLEFRSDFLIGGPGSKSFGFLSTLGGSYNWYNNKSMSVFSGLGVGFGSLRTQVERIEGSYNYKETERTYGFATSIDTGVVFFRHADVNLDVRARLNFMPYTLNGSFPLLGGLVLGIRF